MGLVVVGAGALAAAGALGCGNKSAGGASGSASGAGAGKGALRIAVIPKGTTHEFWKSVHAGAVKAARELGVEPLWKGPLKEDDLKEQIGIVEGFAAEGVSGIVLAPLNDKALATSVKNAVRAGVPVVVFDSGLTGEEHASFVATNNKVAGKLAGERLGKLVAGAEKKNVLLLRYLEGSASTSEREAGFLEGIGSSEGVKVASDNQYGGATTESAMAASESLLLAQGADKGEVAGVFCPNESTTFGMLLALRKLGLAGKVKLVGFDASAKLVAALSEGHVDGLVVQNPFQMGYLAVKTMVSVIRGEKVERLIDTGARLVDRDNMGAAEVKELLHPNLAAWLDE
ncbi:MAG: substrate-binding domain-containing protein [Myxococcales bacterium]|nr:substrate-binding domain-containing protein [Myxococcales bacterium]